MLSFFAIINFLGAKGFVYFSEKLRKSWGRLLKNKCEIHWKSTGLPFEIRWTSPGSPVEVQWKSTRPRWDELYLMVKGSPVEVQWKSSGSPMDFVTYFLIAGLWYPLETLVSAPMLPGECFTTYSRRKVHNGTWWFLSTCKFTNVLNIVILQIACSYMFAWY